MGKQEYRYTNYQRKSLEIILDTNILIEILKNNKETIKEVEKYDSTISA